MAKPNKPRADRIRTLLDRIDLRIRNLRFAESVANNLRLGIGIKF